MGQYKIFKGTEFEGVQGAQVQQISQFIKQKFDHKRNRYHLLRNQAVMNQNWDGLNEKIIDFDQNKFNPWNQRWNNAHRANDINQLKEIFNEGMNLFSELDEYVENNVFVQNNSEEVESLKKEILNQVEEDILNLKTDISVQIEKGINDLVGLKAELGLQKNFQRNIELELKNSNIIKSRFLWFFVVSILSIPLFLASTFLADIFKSLQYAELLFLRIGVSLSLSILSYFAFTQYKLYQFINLRYSHLHGFLGGGATFIGQLIGSEDDSKKDINRKMAELFMELDEVFGLVKKNNHPIELTLDKASEVVDKFIQISNKMKC